MAEYDSYNQAIDSVHKGCVLFLLDQSASMIGRLGNSNERKCDQAAKAINRWLENILIMNAGGEGYKDRFDIGVIGYRTDMEGNPIIESALGGDLADKELVTIAELAENARHETMAKKIADPETGELMEMEVEVPVWVRPVCGGGALMCRALSRCYEILNAWVDEHPDSFPPLLVHVTDGECMEETETDPTPMFAPIPYADSIRELATNDGPALIFNCFLSITSSPPIRFPNSDEGLPDEFARVLFAMSSVIPPKMRDLLDESGFELQHKARAFAYNTDISCFLQFLDVGTKVATSKESLGGGVATADPVLAAPTEQEPADVDAERTPALDENVQFTVYRPKSVRPQEWYDLLAFAHLDELPPDAALGQPHPVEEVKRQAAQILGSQVSEYRESSEDSRQAVPHGGEIVFLPEMEGVEFNPPRQTFKWLESVHRVDFRMHASVVLDGKTARGRMSVFLGAILLADINLTIRVNSEERASSKDLPLESVSARRYRKLFASYSHRDVSVVRQFTKWAKGVGDTYLRDTTDLRAGEIWSDSLKAMIDEADVFQLFWSSRSMRSDFVRQEWQYALSLNRDNFIRPVYWEEPLPETATLPPGELKRIHFQFIGEVVGGTGESQVESEVASETPRAVPERRCSQRHTASLGDDDISSCMPRSASASGRYYIRSRGEVRGPFTAKDLERLAKRGKFGRLFQVSSDGGVNWGPAVEYPELFPTRPERKVRRAAPVEHDDAASDIGESATPADSQWYYALDDQTLGPVSFAELQTLASRGRLTGEHLVKSGGMADWVKARCVLGLFSAAGPRSEAEEDLLPRFPITKSPERMSPAGLRPRRRSRASSRMPKAPGERMSRAVPRRSAKDGQRVTEHALLWFIAAAVVTSIVLGATSLLVAYFAGAFD